MDLIDIRDRLVELIHFVNESEIPVNVMESLETKINDIIEEMEEV